MIFVLREAGPSCRGGALGAVVGWFARIYTKPMPRFIASHQTGQRNFNTLPMDATSQESLHTFIERIRHCKHCHIPTALGLAFDAFPKSHIRSLTAQGSSAAA